ncbi:Fe-S cluster assembly protein HesB [Microlunatus elymi]|uniref:Fe-S cluster assembly protein HesB n=1 Tax=Microlunatus elymi TaxID=2596828 RepID=A0A516PUB5_9ACTN|nr:Fe-S cluster assembly protein HesB [Microlunatus elymi]QDP94786.1 Fe-S cluster assembly protein HesB [Microlunatus elymi]
MLTLTENASNVVTTIVDKQIQSEDAGLRISGPTDGAFAIAAVPSPEPGDTLVESGDAKVYLEQSATEVLDDKILDAQVTEAGDVQFQLAQQG